MAALIPAPVASSCGAPAGIALSADEASAFVFCRATYDLAEVRLDPDAQDLVRRRGPPAPATSAHLADEPLDANVGLGRRLFYNAGDRVTSGGLACAGCHPDGRDDGFVWHEAKFTLGPRHQRELRGRCRPEDVPDAEDH